MKNVKVTIEIDGVVISEEDTKTFHKENLDDIFSEEYEQETEQEQLLWCLECVEDAIEEQFRIIKKPLLNRD